MIKRLHTVLPLSLTVLLLATGCSKEAVQQPEPGTVTGTGIPAGQKGNNLESELLNSCEFTNYVHATNAMVALMQDPANTAPFSGITECNYGAYTREEATAFLSFTTETGKLLGNMAMQADAVKSFAVKYKLDPASNAALWHKVTAAHRSFFNHAEPGGVSDQAAVVSETVQAFIRETVDCLALRDYPRSDTELYLSCQVTAVLNAAGTLTGNPGF